MRETFIRATLLMVFVMLLASLSYAAFPSSNVADCLGVNIHFTGAPSRDLDMIQAGGWKFIRMDFTWSSVEKQQGVYTYTAYDQLVSGLAARGIRPYFILDYSNTLYETDRSVRTAAGRQAFANFAAAAVSHFSTSNVIWEIWNEPNISGFWSPAPSASEYMALVQAAVPAMRQADPNACIIAPATSTIDLTFLESCFQQGLLNYVDGISVHPYRQSNPETVAGEYSKLRTLIARYAPTNPLLPIVSGEWGYSSIWTNFDANLQGRYLPREYLTNLWQGIPLSIWYDWHDDGTSTTDPEHHFGTVTYDYLAKPAYTAMQALTTNLSGKHCVKRLASASSSDYLMFFTNGTTNTLAAWTTGDAHDVSLIDGQTTTLTGDVQYITVPSTQENLLAEGAWWVTVNSYGIITGPDANGSLAPGFTIHVKNPFTTAIDVSLSTTVLKNVSGSFLDPSSFTLDPGETADVRWQGTNPTRRDKTEYSVTVAATVNGYDSEQVVTFQPTNPLSSMSAMLMRNNEVAAVIKVPAGTVFNGTLTAKIGLTTVTKTVTFDGTAQIVSVSPTSPAPGASFANGSVIIPLTTSAVIPSDTIQITLSQSSTVVADSGAIRINPCKVVAATTNLRNDGDSAVAATYSLTDVTYTETDRPVDSGVHFTYSYDAGWKFVQLEPLSTAQPVVTGPASFGVWVLGNTTNCTLNMRFTDSNGRTFQPSFGKLNFTGWRYMTVRLDDPTVGHWGGTGDASKIAYPIRIITYVLVDSPRTAVQGTVDFANFEIITNNPIGVAAMRAGQVGAVLSVPTNNTFSGSITGKVGTNSTVAAITADGSTGSITASPTAPAPGAAYWGDKFVIPLNLTVSLPTNKVRVTQQDEASTVLADSGDVTITPLNVTTTNTSVASSGDANVSATFSLANMTYTDTNRPVDSGARLTYSFGAGWKFIEVKSVTPQPTVTGPCIMGVWVYGNNTNDTIRMRYVDGNGRTFQPTFGRLNFTGWRFMTVRLDDPNVGKWGGTGDANTIAYPITITTYFLVDSTQTAHSSSVDFANIQLINPQ
ncbi:MAG TPA: cellulase family glycosylhydrolase [Armatimonadota bacterium]|nr:cellulase family glycosylhydrolase [Armatimonadota bacterium]